MASLHAETVTGFYRELLSSSQASIFFGVWIVNIACMLTATWIELPPYEYVLLQGALGLLHMVVSHLELVWIPAWSKARLQVEPHRAAEALV